MLPEHLHGCSVDMHAINIDCYLGRSINLKVFRLKLVLFSIEKNAYY